MGIDDGSIYVESLRSHMKRRAVIGATATLVSLAGCVFADGDLGVGSDSEPEYERGELEVVVDNSEIDLSADRFQAEHADNHSIEFHLHEHDEYWYIEGEGPVTFATGIDLLPHFEYSQQNETHVVTIDGTEYDGREAGTTVTFLANGETVEPTAYELQDGDDLRLEITTDN